MFCKFCGQTLDSGAMKCSRCGKEVPARTAFGGFRRFPEGGAVPVSKPVQPVGVPAEQPKQETPMQQMLSLLPLILAAVLVIALILIGVQGAKISRLEYQLKALDKDLSDLTDLLEEHCQEGTEEEADPTTPVVPEPDYTDPVVPTTGETVPSEETPGEETPGEETPGEETPGEETPGEETPGEETPGEETPGEETPDGETPGEETPGDEIPGEEAADEETSGGETTDTEEAEGAFLNPAPTQEQNSNNE